MIPGLVFSSRSNDLSRTAHLEPPANRASNSTTDEPSPTAARGLRHVKKTYHANHKDFRSVFDYVHGFMAAAANSIGDHTHVKLDLVHGPKLAKGIDEFNVAKLSDFGIAEVHGKVVTHSSGTIPYVSPEVLHASVSPN